MLINHLKLLQLESDGDQNNAEFMVDLNNSWEALPPDGDTGGALPPDGDPGGALPPGQQLGDKGGPYFNF